MKFHILITEDDENVANGLSDILKSYGYQVSVSDNSADTIEILNRENIALVILDVCLGEDSGYDLCKKIREFSDVPILFLTGCSSELELIRGFQVGGDDYVTKPFRMQELLVRMQAILRRSSLNKEEYYQSGDLYYNHFTHQMIKGKEALPLTSVELKIAVLLLKSWPNTITRKDLLYHVWDNDFQFVEENTLNVNVSRLRDKLGTFEEAPYITTIRGVGYRWAVPVKRCQKSC